MAGDRLRNECDARRWLAALATFLVLARALVPSGYMPDLKGFEAGFRFVVCHAGEPFEAPVAPTGGDAPADACPFAPLAHGALLLAALLVWARLAIAPQSRPLAPARPIAARRINPRPIGARAPPVPSP